MPKIGEYSLPSELYFTPNHTWAKVEPNGTVRVGFDDYGQKLAGKIEIVDLPPVGGKIEQFKAFGTIESAKWVGTLVAPVSGTVRSVNRKVRMHAGLINDDPYGEGWLILVHPANVEEELKDLLHGDKAIEWLNDEIRKR